MKIQNSKLIDGFTLVEFLVYSMIVTAMTGALVLTGVNLMQARAKIGIIEEVNHNSRTVMEKMIYHVQQAESINSPALNSTSTVLSLEMEIPAENPIVFEVNKDDELTMKKGTDTAVPLTTEKVKVSFLEFTNTSYTTSTPGTIRIEMMIEHDNPTGRAGYDFERTFYTTANIRK